MSSNVVKVDALPEPLGTPTTNVLFGAFFLALERLQLSSEHDMAMGECVALVDPAVVECVLRHWMLADSRVLFEQDRYLD
jgi:hypothetical protein